MKVVAKLKRSISATEPCGCREPPLAPGFVVATYTGQRFNLLRPDPDSVRIEDIAHGLAHDCQITGHDLGSVSVAQHALRVHDLVARRGIAELCRAALVHRAAEAYCSLAAPALRPLSDERCQEIRCRLNAAIRRALCVQMVFANQERIIDDAERLALAAGVKRLAKAEKAEYADGMSTLEVHPPEEAERRFLQTYRRYVAG